MSDDPWYNAIRGVASSFAPKNSGKAYYENLSPAEKERFIRAEYEGVQPDRKFSLLQAARPIAEALQGRPPVLGLRSVPPDPNKDPLGIGGHSLEFYGPSADELFFVDNPQAGEPKYVIRDQASGEVIERFVPGSAEYAALMYARETLPESAKYLEDATGNRMYSGLQELPELTDSPVTVDSHPSRANDPRYQALGLHQAAVDITDGPMGPFVPEGHVDDREERALNEWLATNPPGGVMIEGDPDSTSSRANLDRRLKALRRIGSGLMAGGPDETLAELGRQQLRRADAMEQEQLRLAASKEEAEARRAQQNAQNEITNKLNQHKYELDVHKYNQKAYTDRMTLGLKAQELQQTLGAENGKIVAAATGAKSASEFNKALGELTGILSKADIKMLRENKQKYAESDFDKNFGSQMEALTTALQTGDITPLSIFYTDANYKKLEALDEKDRKAVMTSGLNLLGRARQTITFADPLSGSNFQTTQIYQLASAAIDHPFRSQVSMQSLLELANR